MPITYRIDPKWRLVEARYEGEVSIEDVRDFAQKVTGDPAFGPEFKLLSIFSGLKTRMSSQDFIGFQALRNRLPQYKQIAIVAPSEFEYGIARMYEQASGGAGTAKMQVFRSEGEARVWLGLSDP